jgi:2-oxo-4-hydroxy-4-carboxy-5-ureidoimidazoline decarboxylase
MNLETINAWALDQARAAFQRCCGSTRWSVAMAQRRPFDSETTLLATADHIWWNLSEVDWLEAFAAHPKIGDASALRARFLPTAAWASREQAGTLGASADVLDRLAGLNNRYEARFGYIFIVCATGKTAEAMLELLERRLLNEPDVEIKIAAAEQAKITRIRLEKIAP